MIRLQPRIVLLALAAAVTLAGCRSPYYADRGALFGGLTGAGLGAIIGDAVGDAGAGAAIGAGVGAMTGAAVGESLDEIDARNRAQIAAQMGRAPQPGAVTQGEVISMSQAGVSPQLIAMHVRNNGMAAPLTSDDIILLHEQGVSSEVIKAMQTPPAPRTVVQPAPVQPVIIEEHHYGRPWYGYHYHHGPHHRRRHHRTSWGFSFSN